MAKFPNGETINYVHNLRFITGIHFTKSMLKALNNITFIFDPNWKVGNSNVPTFPVCFYHVKESHEIMETEISQKTALFYNDSSDSNSTAFKNEGLQGAITNVVADNIVIKPKQYKLDIIIPFLNSTMLTDKFILSSLSGVTTTLVTGVSRTESLLNKMQANLSCATSLYEVFKGLIASIVTVNDGSSADVAQSIFSTPDYNKNSLEAMWLNRSILKMKMWNNWKYKYVAITSLDISKEPTEDGVYEATMTVQEVPIMTFRRSGIPTTGYINPILSKTGEAVINLLDDKGV